MHRKTFAGRVLGCLCAILSLMTLSLHAGQGSQSVTFAWDANTEPDLAGYILYYGSTSHNYTSSTNVGNNTTFTLRLQKGSTYFVAVTAYNSWGIESDFSNEIGYTVPVSNAAPVLKKPSKITAAVASFTPITGLDVMDADAESGVMHVRLSAGRGSLRLSANVPGGLVAQQISYNNSSFVEITAPLSAIHATLTAENGVVYMPDSKQAGTDVLTLAANDNGNSGLGGPKNAFQTIPIEIGADTNSSRSGGMTVAPGAVTLITPVPGETTCRSGIQFSWKDSTNGGEGVWYRIYISTSDGKQCVDTWTKGTTFELTKALSDGNYSWWVQGWNQAGLGKWSSGGSFSAHSCAPNSPMLFTPVDAALSSPRVNYSWSVENASWYEILVTKDGKTYLDKWVQAPQDYEQKISCDAVLAGHKPGLYSWSVRGWNSDGTGPWSSTGNFSISYGAPGMVNLYSPTGTVYAPTNLTFSWSEAPTAEWYCLQVDCNGTNYLSRWVQDASFTETNALPGGDYTWSVQGWNAMGLGAHSSTNSFTMVADGTPLAPIGTFAAGDPCYRWHGDGISTWYELYVKKDGVLFFDGWVAAANLNVGSDRALEDSGIPGHTPGNYTWWVRAWSPVTGSGAWSEGAKFTLTE